MDFQRVPDNHVTWVSPIGVKLAEQITLLTTFVKRTCQFIGTLRKLFMAVKPHRLL